MGPDGLIKQLTKTMIETLLNEEMARRGAVMETEPLASGKVAVQATLLFRTFRGRLSVRR